MWKRFRREAHPDSAVAERIQEIVSVLTAGLEAIEPFSAIEMARLMCLPFYTQPEGPPTGTDDGRVITEILSLAAVTAHLAKRPEQVVSADQEFARWMDEVAIPLARELMDLASFQELLRLEHDDALGNIAVSVRSSTRWIRDTSYPNMQEEALLDIFARWDSDDTLRGLVGFTAAEAVAILKTCHEIQLEKLNLRGRAFAEALNTARSTPGFTITADQRKTASESLRALLNPLPEEAAASLAEIAANTGIDPSVVEATVAFYTLNAEGDDMVSLLNAYIDAESPFQRTPLIWLGSELVALPHQSLVLPAIKDGLEAALKASSVWDDYQTRRAEYLEQRVGDLLDRVLPGVTSYHGLEYLVPASDDEVGKPDRYTKLVEGDHLFVLDDVAIVVEDKAIPMSARSRAGQYSALRRNLLSAILKGAEQANRLRDRIIEDQSLRLRDGRTLDLSSVREVHTIVTSLDDLSGITTATSQLVEAGLLPRDGIPWTVSLNDLDLITQLIDRTAEFILYLQRRRNPIVTHQYQASDELDLFLFFFSCGLYIEPDPDEVAAQLEWMGEPRIADRRRYADQLPTFITSHTDQLDRWYYSRDSDDKPRMSPAPLDTLIQQIAETKVFGWASIGAALLSLGENTQRTLVKIAGDLLDNPDVHGRERSMTVPIGTTKADAWLFVWMTMPLSADPQKLLDKAYGYLLTKKHQLNLVRGAAFLYDEPTGELFAVVYTGDTLDDGDPRVAELTSQLRAPEDMSTWAQLTQQSRNRRKRSRN